MFAIVFDVLGVLCRATVPIDTIVRALLVAMTCATDHARTFASTAGGQSKEA